MMNFTSSVRRTCGIILWIIPLLLFQTNRLEAQCYATAAYGTASIDLSGNIVSMSPACAYQGEYATVTGAVAGQTLQVTSVVAGTFITVSSGVSSGAIAWGTTPLTFSNTVSGTIYVHYHANSACGTASVCNNGTVQLLLPACSAPSAQPTAVNFPSAGSSSITGSFTAAAGSPTGYLVVRYPTGASPTNPTNQASYTTGQALGAGTVVQMSSATSFTATGLALSTTYDFYIYAYNSTPGTCTPAYLTSGAGPYTFSTTGPGTVTSTGLGGLWSSPATWVGGAPPASFDNAVIAAGATVTIDQVITVNSLTVNGTLQWNGTSNAFTTPGNITINAGGRFLPYTTAAGMTTGVTLNVGGNFVNDGYANLSAGTTTQCLLNFNGSQQTGGSLNQTLSGTGVFQGDGTYGIIRQLFFQTTGSSTINTTQNLVTYSFGHTAGSLNTNGKLRIDNRPQAYGLAMNRQVASVHVTTMGTGYTVAPVVFGTAVTQWTSGGIATAGIRYWIGNNVYVCTVAGTFGASAPVNTTPLTETNGTATLLWVGNLGTLGNPFQITAVTQGTLYFCGDNLYVCTSAGGTPSAAAPPVHTSGIQPSGTASFLYIGSPAKVSVNYDPATLTVRSLNLVSGGNGYTSATAPSLTFSVGVFGGAGSGAVATALVPYSGLVAPINTLTQKSGVAAITGGLTINSDQGASLATANPQASSGIAALFTTGGGTNYTIAPTVGFAGPTALNLVTNGGSGFTTNPTITVTGGNLVSGAALTSANFTITVNQGKVVSVYLNASTTACYSTPPTLAFTGGGGTGATLDWPVGCWPAATANIGSNRQLESFTITNAGFGYVVAPTVGIGPTSGTANGGTFTSVATTPTARVALYNLTLNFFTPAAAPAVAQADDNTVIPANRKINNLSLAGNGNGLNLTNNLTLYGTAPLTLTASGSVPGNVLNLGGNNLYCSWNGYAGTTSTFGATNVYLTNGSMTLTTRGGGTTGSTLNFPFDATFTTFTGSGTSAANGASVQTVTVRPAAAPSGSASPGTATGTRTFRVQSDAGSLWGTNPTVTLRYNSNDNLLMTQNYTFVGQAAATSGPWTTRSNAYGASGALPITGALTTVTTGVGPIVPTNDDYYAWINTTPAPTISSFQNTGYFNQNFCQGGGETVDIVGTNFVGVSSVTFNGTPAASYVVNSPTSITAVTPAGISAGVITVTAGGVPGSSAAYTVFASGLLTSTLSPSNGLICVSGGSVDISLNDILADSYDWTGGPGLNSYTGLNVTASPTTSTAYTVTAPFAFDGCAVIRTFNVGVLPPFAFTPTATPAAACQGSSVQLNAGISAGNFGVSSIPHAPATVPGVGVTTIASAGLAVIPMTSGTLDDGGWGNIPLGFTYNFFGTNFTSINVGTNGVLQFGAYNATQIAQYTGFAAFPSPSNPANIIAWMANDLNVGTSPASSSIRFWNDGVAPTRRFIIQYTDIAQYGSPANLQNVQVILYETTGLVEIHITQALSTNSKFVALQNAGTIGAAAPGRNGFTAQITVPEAWRFIPPANYTYAWTPAAGLTPSATNGTPTTPALNTLGNVTYNVAVTNPTTGCTNTNSVVIPVNERPTGVVTGGGTVCNGQTQPDVTFTFTGTGPWNLTYNNGTGNTTVNNIATSPYVITGANSGVYTINALSDALCSAIAADLTGSATVVVHPRPTATVSGGGTVCVGNPLPDVSIALTGTGPWNLTYSNGVGTISVTATASPFVITAAPVGTYTVVSLSDANCTATAGDMTGSATNAFATTLTAGSLTTSAVVCDNTNFSITANTTGGAGPYTYSWAGGVTGSTMTVTANLASGNYTGITAYVFDGCGANVTVNSPINVNALPTPLINPTPANSAICSGSPTSVSLAATGGVSYSWSPATGLSSTTAPTVSANPAGTTTYTVFATDGNGCVGATSQMVGVGSAITMGATTATPAAFCPGGNSVLATSASFIPPSTYCTPSYSNGTGFGDWCSLVQIVGTTLNNATGASASPYYTLYPATGNTTATLTAGTTYTIVFSGGTYTVNDFAAWIDYNGNGVFSDPGENLGQVNDLGAAPATGSFTFTVPFSATNGLARLRVREADQSGTIDPCLGLAYGETEDYDVTIVGGVNPTINYVWSPATFLSGTTGATVNANAVTSTTTYTATASSSVGCIATGSATVTVIPRPTSVVSGGGAACAGLTLPDVSIALTGTGPWNLSWTDGSSTVAATAATSPYVISGAAAGTYKVTSLSDASCTAIAADMMDSATVVVNTPPCRSSIVAAAYEPSRHLPWCV